MLREVQYLRRVDQRRDEYDRRALVINAIAQQARLPDLRDGWRGGGGGRPLRFLIATQADEGPSSQIGIMRRFAPQYAEKQRQGPWAMLRCGNALC